MTKQETNNLLRKNLLDTYASRSALEKKIIQVISIGYERLTRSDLMKMFRKLDIKNSDGNWFIHKTLTPVIDKLADADLLQWINGGVRCHDLIIEDASQFAIKECSFADITKILQAYNSIKNRYGNRISFKNYRHGLQEFRISLYLKEYKKEIGRASCRERV